MKFKPMLLFLALIGAGLVVRAGITGTNLFPFATLTAGTNASTVFIAPQAHTINPLSTQLYHSITNGIPATNILQVTFDGGQTWANVASYTNSTNSQNETWNISYTTLEPSNRVLVITASNQTYYGAATWNQ